VHALITGAAAGLAQGAAIALARDGGCDRIGITYRTTPPDTTLAAIGAAGAQAGAYRVDFLDDPDVVGRELDAIVRAEGPFDILVHGVGPMTIGRFAKASLTDYREMFDGNVRSALQTVQAVLPGMRERGFGRIVVFGMNGSSITRPVKSFALHLAAKSALVAFARTLALEEASHGITVNVIEPGDIRDKYVTRAQALARSAGNPRGRPGTWEDVADAVLFFTRPSADFVTGTVLAVNGGLQGASEPHPEANAPQ
jgi:3-oxoacyl-[acyl-carrier protein] reductase